MTIVQLSGALLLAQNMRGQCAVVQRRMRNGILPATAENQQAVAEVLREADALAALFAQHAPRVPANDVLDTEAAPV